MPNSSANRNVFRAWALGVAKLANESTNSGILIFDLQTGFRGIRFWLDFIAENARFTYTSGNYFGGSINNIVSENKDSVTQLLIELTEGRNEVLEALLPVVYSELRSLANNYLRRERADHTLQPTALVHEAYLKLVDQRNVKWQNRAHFFGVAANIMRRILVDHARRHNAEKRGGEFSKEQLEEALVVVTEQKSFELLALDDALEELAKMDPQKSRIVELRYFGGLSVEETAEVMGVSEITVKRHWKMAKAWLYGQIARG